MAELNDVSMMIQNSMLDDDDDDDGIHLLVSL